MRGTLHSLALALLLLPIGAALADSRPLHVLGLSDAVDPALLDGFTEATGVPVLFDGVATEGDIEAALRRPDAPADLVLLSADGLGKRLPLDLLQPLPASLPGAAAVDRRLRAALPEATAARTVPFDWYPLGFAVDTAKLKEADLPTDSGGSWALFAKPDLLRQVEACGLGVPERPQDLFALALAAGAGPRSGSPTIPVLERRRALATLTQLRLQARRGGDADLADGLAQGEFCAVLLPGPAAFLAMARAEAANPGATLRFVLPAGGGVLGMDVLAVPARADNRDGALRLLSFLLRPDTAAANARFGHVAPAVGTATDPEAFTDDRVLDTLVLPGPGDPLLERAVEAEWRRNAVR